ncbi:MAG: CPBP family intramembrane glutamic endopeptidase [Paracoccaceae bacterium]
MFNAFFDRYVEPARARSQLWRLIVGSIVITVVYLAWLAVLFGVIWLAVGRDGMVGWSERIATASTPTATLLLMASFIGMALAPMAAVRWVHKRSVASLFGPSVRLVRDFTIAAGTVLAVYAVLLLVWSFWFDAKPNLPFGLWLTFLPLALCGLLIQTLAEELVFRAYLMQQLAARFRSPLIWMLLPAAVFGIFHYNPGAAGGNVWIVIGAAAAFGLVAADLTRITGCIGAAWGYHFANNFVAILILSTEGTIPGMALYLTPYAIDDTQLVPLLSLGDLAVMVLVWLILRRVVRR